MTITPEAATPARRSHWRRWRIGWLLGVAVVGFLGYCAWRQYDFRQAIKEAKALGWDWQYDDPIESDWKAAFRKESWENGQRALVIPSITELKHDAELLRRLAPKSLWIYDSSGLNNLSLLEGLTGLQEFFLYHGNRLVNVDALKGLTTLQDLVLHGCSSLTNVDALKGLTALRRLNLEGCVRITNVDALKGLSTLKTLELSDCAGLINVNGLHGLTALKKLELWHCSKLSSEAFATLREALRGTTILGP